MSQPDSFSLAEFLDPPCRFWPGYFWLLNDALTEEQLLSQLHDMYDHGARSVCLLPEPSDFRPYHLGTEMSPDYLSDEFMLLIRSVVAQCDRLGMNYWLYDEGGWPSGGACGRVYRQDPERFGRRFVQAQMHHLEPDQPFTVPDSALCAALEDDLSKVFYPGQTIVAGTTSRTVRLCSVEREPVAIEKYAPHVDALSHEATDAFIELTHQKYHNSIGDSFGKSIRFVFTDEPAATRTYLVDEHPCLTWTADMPEAFRQKKGYDLLPHLPALLTPPDDNEPFELTRVRLDFYDVWTQLLVERYLEPIRHWCRQHGLLSGGHLGGEDEPRGNADCGYGHILRTLRCLDLPGVDTIWRQTFPGVRSHQFPKYASSVARQAGLPYVFSESFGVFGNGLTPGQMKWVTDQQYLRGINLMVIGCYPYSTREHLMPGERPHFGRVNPLWPYMDIYHAYTARLGYLLTRGKPVCNTAVYFDIRGIWAGAGHRERSIKYHDEIAAALLNAQCDFDYVDDDVLAASETANGQLIIGEMSYDTLIIPTTRWMTRNAMDAVTRFVAEGGRVITVGPMPGCDGQTDAENSLCHSAGAVLQTEVPQLAQHIKPVATLMPPRSEVRIAQRQWDSGSCYFITSETDEKLMLTVRFDERGSAVLCEPDTGKFTRPVQRSVAGGAEIDLSLEPWGSAVVLFGVTDDVKYVYPVPNQAPASSLDLAQDWTIRPLRQYRVGEHDYEIAEIADAQPQPVTLGDWQSVLGGNFSGDAEYSVTFDCAEDDAGRKATIILGEVRYSCRAILNGHDLGRRIWQPFAFDVSGHLRAGLNELRITVTNTLANALLDEKVIERWDSLEGPGWHKGRATYDHAARAFEIDSLPSGLFGPVTLEFAD